MADKLAQVKIGLALVILGLAFGVSLGIGFGVNEEGFKTHISQEISANPGIHDDNSQGKIWRYVQRAHFHATGISAFSLGLILLVMFTGMKASFKKASSILIGLSGFYPLSWYMMFLLAPGIGRDAAHDHILTVSCVFIGVTGLILGTGILIGNLFLGLFAEQSDL